MNRSNPRLAGLASPASAPVRVPRRSSGLILFGLLAVVVAFVAVLTWLAWQGARQSQLLQAELRASHAAQAQLEVRLRAVQSTVESLQDRVAQSEANDLERRIVELEGQVEAADGFSQLQAAKASTDDFQTRLDRLSSSLGDLSTRVVALEAEKPLPQKARLVVPSQRQTHSLSCEAAATSMVAQFRGVELTEEAVLSALPRNKNPNMGFRGNVDGTPGGVQDYGVYAGPISEILNAQGLPATLVSGGLPGIRAAVARGNPVIAWVTYGLQPSMPVVQAVEGESVVLVPYQHVVVVTGYNGEGFWVNDPWDGQEHFYASAALERSLGYFDNMAIEVGRP